MNQKKNNWRTIFIWDIHGCYDEFMLLLEKLEISKEDNIYLVGDLTNKWPKSIKILKYLLFNNSQFKSVLWNNEYYILQYLQDKLEENHPNYKETKVLCKRLTKRPELVWYVRNIPSYIEEKYFILVHAWILEWNYKNQPKETLSWADKRIKNDWFLNYKWKKKIIYWHNSSWWIRIKNNTIWIDSWCVFWGYLSAYILETWEIIQQKAFKIYEKVWYNIWKDLFNTKNF